MGVLCQGSGRLSRQPMEGADGRCRAQAVTVVGACLCIHRSPPGDDIGPGSRLGGSPPLDTNIRQRLEYSRCAFQAGDRSRAFEGRNQCGCARGCARGSEAASPEMLRNYLGRIDKSARYPFGQLGIERRQLVRQILHETSILEIGGDHFGRECTENPINKIQSIACRLRRDVLQYGNSTCNVMVDRFFCELSLSARKVKVERSFRRTAFFKDLGQSSRSVALDAKKPFRRGDRASACVSLTCHAVNIPRFA